MSGPDACPGADPGSWEVPTGSDPAALVAEARALRERHPARIDWPEDCAPALLAELSDALERAEERVTDIERSAWIVCDLTAAAELAGGPRDDSEEGDPPPESDPSFHEIAKWVDLLRQELRETGPGHAWARQEQHSARRVLLAEAGRDAARAELELRRAPGEVERRLSAALVAEARALRERHPARIDWPEDCAPALLAELSDALERAEERVTDIERSAWIVCDLTAAAELAGGPRDDSEEEGDPPPESDPSFHEIARWVDLLRQELRETGPGHAWARQEQHSAKRVLLATAERDAALARAERAEASERCWREKLTGALAEVSALVPVADAELLARAERAERVVEAARKLSTEALDAAENATSSSDRDWALTCLRKLHGALGSGEG